ncbi:low affinity immunoglobulin gamma Fc region receptor II-like [Danio aesculapii]|uniref:low affinity immunoglobulin gamma Fc region receptor II-like n=1 Tax=Danio aesculapii TaxID=1142201 RepID=UPI0024BFA6F4|nr:low affinity immunoglobulin gamma Fc region receptor II-like [Danio aesculapii]
MELSQLPLVLLLISNIHSEDTEENPKANLTITPDLHVFRRESVTLRCDINADGVSSWQYSWYKEGSDYAFSELQEYTLWFITESDAGKYSCIGTESKGSRRSLMSDAVPLTVSAQTALSVSPQNWLTEGDSVTLICEVHGSSTGWTFSWYIRTHKGYHYKLLSDSSRGAGGKYTVSSVALKHTGVYVCEAERGKTAYKTAISNTQPLWVTGVSPPDSLVIRPSRAQHFTSDSLSLSCEDKSNSTGWRVRRYLDSGWMSDCLLQTGSTCTISYTTTSDTGVYWCQSESGENYNPVNITVHSGVILESPVHPVTEGDTLTLQCLYKSTTPPNLTADFYKDGSLVQSQTSEMIITAVSKSHEGFYYCKHTEGESPKSWISVRVSPSASRSDGVDPVINGVTAGLSVLVLIIIFLVLLCCYRHKKGVRSPSPSSVSQTSQQKQSEAGHQTLLSGTTLKDRSSTETAHTYATYEDICNTDCESGAELTYAEVHLKSTKKMKENTDKGNNPENSDCVYSKLKLETHQSAGSSDGTYAQVK